MTTKSKAKCEAYTLYREIDSERKLIHGQGETPEDALRDARKNGHFGPLSMQIDGEPAWKQDGQWFTA